MHTDQVAADHPRPGVLRIRLERGGRRNALDTGMVNDLCTAFSGTEARAIVLDSGDPEAFCSGVDLDLEDGERAVLSDELYRLYGLMAGHRAPVIAAVNGPAVGGGAQLALACDLRVGGPRARFRFAGVGHGLAVGAWGLPSLVGGGRALDLCLTMRWVDAPEALAMGLLTRLADDPGADAVALAGELLRYDAEAIRRVKALVRGPADQERLTAERTGNRHAWSGAVHGPRRDLRQRSRGHPRSKEGGTPDGISGAI